MANHDPSHPTAPGNNQPLVPASMHDQGGPLEVSQPFASPTFSRTPAVVNGGMDASWFLNSLRRRWLLATCMGLLLAAGAGAALYYLFPESDTAMARFLVSSKQETLLDNGINISGPTESFDIYKATQVQMIKGPKVLRAAMKNPDMQKVGFLRQEENPEMWLYENLDVRFEGNSELMRVSLTLDENAEEMETAIRAICEAYMEEVVRASRIERMKLRDALKATRSNLMAEIREKRDEFLRLSEELGITPSGQFDPSVRMLFDELSAKMRQRAELEEQIVEIQLQYENWRNTKNNPGLQEQQVDAMVSANENIAYQEQEILALQARLRDAEKRSSGRATRLTRRIQKDLNFAQQSLAQERNQLRQQIKQQIANQPDYEIALVTEQMQRRLGYLNRRLLQLMQGRDVPQEDGSTEHEMGINELKETLEAKAVGSTDLTIRNAELQQLDEVAYDLSQRIQAWDIELDPKAQQERVQLVEAAYTMPGINKFQRYAITGLGSIATLVLTCLGIAYLEFMGRRLNGPEQVDEGLGIRVVGTLPALNAKRMMNPKHPLVAQLTESIDSVRTALMHDSTSKPRQVVLVTSPSAMEGRTTVASQLAASLARAGRRTLLIDGDLRRPALHVLFDVPLEDGLCEVLRTEVDVADVVRPTHAENLWLMTAGYCDADAVHAMATDQIQPIFEKLRDEFDFVIIDGAPVLGLSDSLMMGQHCDGVLLSVLRDHTSVPSIYKSTELLRDVGVRLIGSVVNGVSARADRRVTHLQIASPKAARKQLEDQHADVAVATKPATKPATEVQDLDDLDDIDFSDLSNDD